MASNFDPNLSVGGVTLLEGECTRLAVTEPASPFPAAFSQSNFVIDPSRPFTVSVDWEIRGWASPVWLAALADNWSVRLYAESQGPGPEQQIGNIMVPVSTGTNPPGDPLTTRFTANVVVPANTLQDDSGGGSGIYSTTVSIFLNSNLGLPGYDITGFHSGERIMAENPA